MRTATKVRYLIRKYAPGVRPVAWNLGAIAAEGSPQARQLFRDVLLASASIPGLFPPVAIEAQSNGRTLQELHADGGITTPFFLAPEPALLGRGRLDRTSAPAHAYVIVNNQLAPEFQVTDRTLITVLGRSLSAAVKAGTRAAVDGACGLWSTERHRTPVRDDRRTLHSDLQGTVRTGLYEIAVRSRREARTRGRGVRRRSARRCGGRQMITEAVSLEKVGARCTPGTELVSRGGSQVEVDQGARELAPAWALPRELNAERPARFAGWLPLKERWCPSQ